MRARIPRIVALAGLLAACGGGSPAAPRKLPAGFTSDASLLRLPRKGGRATLLRADVLTPLDWQISSGVPGIARGLGTDLEDRTVYAVDNAGHLVGFDLLTRRWRQYLGHARQMSSTPDGIILGLDSARRPVRFANRTLTTYRASLDGGQLSLMRGPGSAVIVANPDAGALQVITEGGESRSFKLPHGPTTETWYGDLVAVTTDSGVLLIDPSNTDPKSRTAPKFVHIKYGPVAAAFSPSGHRLYVARTRGDLLMFDRFSREQLRTLKLPGAPLALRVDRTGRWLLAEAGSGDSLWVVDLARWELAASFATTWADDLPLVADGRTLILRQRNDVEAYDISGVAPVSKGRLTGGASDLYLAIPWAPSVERTGGQVVASLPPPAPDDSAAVAAPPTTPPGDAGAKPGIPAPTPGASVYVQVSSSQNQDYAKALAPN